MKTAKEIKPHLRNGDYAKIGKMTGVTRKYARQLMNRESADKHEDVLKAARRVALSNIKLGL